MWFYLIKRIILFVPTLLIITVFTFFLLKSAPGDPIESQLMLSGINSDDENSRINYDEHYRLVKKQMGLDLPSFYFSIVPSNFPKNIHNIDSALDLQIAKQLLKKGFSWNRIVEILKNTKKLEKLSYNNSLSFQQKNQINDYLKRFAENHQSTLPSQFFVDTIYTSKIIESFENFRTEAQDNEMSIFPIFYWHGLKNQYHFWLSKILKGDFGVSLLDGSPIREKIMKSLRWTFVLVFCSIFLASILSITIGILAAEYYGSWFDRISSFIMFTIYGIPVFWLATMSIVFFTTVEYGEWTKLFPGIGISQVGFKSGSMELILANIEKLILPILIITLHLIAYIARQTRSNILQQKSLDFVKNAYAKGLSKKRVLVRHVLPNALLPIVTIITSMFAGGLSGSVIIEEIFNIPGMGSVLFNAIFNSDWPTIFISLLILSIATLVVYLLTDLLYAFLNPRINFES